MKARRTRGFALIAVLWVVTALALAVTGLVNAARGGLSAASALRDRSQAAALAEAAATLAAREQATTPPASRPPFLERDVDIEGRRLHVSVVQLDGLVNPNTADELLLTRLFERGADIDHERALRLAQRVIDWRDRDGEPLPLGAEDPAYLAEGSPFRTRGGPFEAAEDLLQVLGLDYRVYQRIRPLVAVEHRGRLNLGAAPSSVLRLLNATEADPEQVRAGAAAGDTPGFIAAARLARYRIEASVELANGAWLRSRRVLELDAVSDGLPWRTLAADERIEAAR